MPDRSRSRSRSLVRTGGGPRHLAVRGGQLYGAYQVGKQVLSGIKRGRTLHRATSRSRSARSTAPKRQRTMGYQSVRGGGQGSDTSYSSYRHTPKTNNKMLRGFKKVFATQRMNSIIDTTIVSVRNQQTPVMLNVFAVSDTTARQWIYEPTGASTTTDMAQVANQRSLLNYFPPAGFPSSVLLNRQQKFMSLGVRVNFRIKNQHNIPVRIVLYDITTRRDNVGAGSPITAWQQGMDNKTTTAGSQIDLAFPGTTPFMSEQFTQNYRVVKTSKFMLHPGSEHQHTLMVKPKYMFNEILMVNQVLLANLSHSVMMVVTGGVGTTGSGVAQEVQLSTAQIAVTAEYSQSYQVYERSIPVLTQYNGLTTTVTPVRAILEDTDVPADEANAS